MLKMLKVYLLRNQKGQGMVEYGLILGLVTVAAIAGLKLIGTDITSYFSSITRALSQ